MIKNDPCLTRKQVWISWVEGAEAEPTIENGNPSKNANMGCPRILLQQEQAQLYDWLYDK